MSSSMIKSKDGVDEKASEKRSRAILAWTGAHGVSSDCLQVRHGADGERPGPSGEKNNLSWCISPFFWGGEDRAPPVPNEDFSLNKSACRNVPAQPLNGLDLSFSIIQLREMSHRCLARELQQFPVLIRYMDEVICNFLRDGLHPAESMITRIIEMEMDHINTFDPCFVVGSKAVELAQQQEEQ